MERTPLDKAIKIAGGQSELARRIGKTQGHISSWRRRGRVPPEVVLSIEAAVGGQVTRYELRHDIYGPKPGAAGVLGATDTLDEARHRQAAE